MHKNASSSKLEDALASLNISDASKKTFSTSFRARNESLLFGYLAMLLGAIFIFGFIISTYMYLNQLRDRYTVQQMIFDILLGLFLFFYGRSRIKLHKIIKATVELVLKEGGGMEKKTGSA